MARWGIDDLDDALWPVRSLLADRPGMAHDGRRSKVFTAAIGQFEQLLRASESVGPASSPILMFYALSQGGRAILAAHGEGGSWDSHGHGLKVDTREQIGATAVSPNGEGLFQAVAASTGSPPLSSSVTLAELWGATPGFVRAQGLGDAVPPLFLFSEPASGRAEIRSQDGGPVLFEEFWDRRGEYPGAGEATFEDVGFTDGRAIFQLVGFPDDEARTRFSSSLIKWLGSYFLRAPLGANAEQPSALVTVWASLLAVSSLARYEPAGWTAALAPQSALAVPIERTLRTVGLSIPQLVLEALKPSA